MSSKYSRSVSQAACFQPPQMWPRKTASKPRSTRLSAKLALFTEWLWMRGGQIISQRWTLRKQKSKHSSMLMWATCFLREGDSRWPELSSYSERSTVREWLPELSLSWISRELSSSLHQWLLTDQTRCTSLPFIKLLRNCCLLWPFRESHQHHTAHRKLAYGIWHIP